jgi:hypothetical protein
LAVDLILWTNNRLKELYWINNIIYHNLVAILCYGIKIIIVNGV